MNTSQHSGDAHIQTTHHLALRWYKALETGTPSHTQGENSTQHKQMVNRTMDTFVCAHSEVSPQYSVNNPVNQSYASSAYIQMRAGFLHTYIQEHTYLHASTAQKHKMSIYVCVHVTLYVHMLNSILLHQDIDVTMSKFTCIESHVAMSVRCLHVSVAQEGSAGAGGQRHQRYVHTDVYPQANE